MCTYSRKTSRAELNCVAHGNFWISTWPWRADVVVQTNIYASQKGRNFTVNNNELKAFLVINYIMAINKLPTTVEYWRVNNLIGNNVIQNTMIRTAFVKYFNVSILQTIRMMRSKVSMNIWWSSKGVLVWNSISNLNHQMGF